MNAPVCGYSAAHTAAAVPADLRVGMGPLGQVPCCTPCADTYDRLNGVPGERLPLAAVRFAVVATEATYDEDDAEIIAVTGPLAFGDSLEQALKALPGETVGEVYAVWASADVEQRAGGCRPDSLVMINVYGDAMALADTYLQIVAI